jgi:hypothetical protein
MGTKQTMTMTAFAKMRGVSRVTANTWRNRGLVIIADNGRVDVARSNAMLADRAETYRGGVVGGTPKGFRNGSISNGSNGHDEHDQTIAQAVAEKEHWLALMQQLRYEKATGRLVEIEAVTAAVARRFVVVKNQMMGLGMKVAPQVCATSDPAEKLRIINAELERATSCLDAAETFREIKRAAALSAGIVLDDEDDEDEVV